MAAKKKAKTPKTEKRKAKAKRKVKKMLPKKPVRRMGPGEMASTGAVAVGSPGASPDLMAGMMGSSNVTRPAVVPERRMPLRKPGRIPAPRRSASPCKGPQNASPM